MNSTKKTAFAFLAVLTLLTFNSVLKSKFDLWAVQPIFSTISSSLLSDVSFTAAFFFMVVVAVRGVRKKFLLGIEWAYILTFFIVVYLACRIVGTYNYERFQIFHKLVYSDVTMISAFMLLMVFVVQRLSGRKSPKYFDTPFLVDIPIRTGMQDLLNRNRFAERIAKKIQSKPHAKNSGALAIGITGEWGSGKTSFSNMVADAIDRENRIILHFNPWRSSSPQKIIEDFFELMVTELGRYDSRLSGNIYSYAKTLTKIDENFFTKSVQTFSELFDGSSKNEIYDSINESIENTKKQIIIFIDDLDRLDSREITEVLRIIRNTANFNNLVYIVSYDQKYVLEAVKSFNIANYSSFLEKIFQFEFTLPMYEASIIRNYLKKILKDALPAMLHREIDAAVDSRAHKSINFTNEIISTHRAAIRLANAVSFELHGLEHEVLFHDFYLLNLFKLRYPAVFKNLFENSSIFFITDFKNKDRFYRLRAEHERNVDMHRLEFLRMMDLIGNSDKNLDQRAKEPIFYSWLEKISDEQMLGENDVHIIKSIVAELLNADAEMNTDLKNKKPLAFARVSNFYKYFSFELMATELSAQEFEISRNLPWQDYSAKIAKWSAEGKSEAFQDRLLKIEDFVSVHEFENHVRALFELGRAYADGNNIYSFDLHYLLQILDYPSKKANVGKLYSNTADFEDFIRELIAKAPVPKKFENYLFSMMMEQNHRFFIGFDEMAEISLTNFREYLEGIDELTSDMWTLYHSTRLRKEDYYSAIKNPEATELVRNFWKAHVKACGLGGLIMQIDPGSEYYYLENDRWQFYFQTLDEFEEWLFKAENIDRESLCFKEFYNFFQLNRGDTSRGIKFNFQYIIPNRWQ